METMVMNITEKDVGREVVLQDGDVETIAHFDGGSIPVFLRGIGWYYDDGHFCGNDTRKDIIGFADEPKTTTLTTPKQKIIDALHSAIDIDLENCEYRQAIDKLEMLMELSDD